MRVQTCLLGVGLFVGACRADIEQYSASFDFPFSQGHERVWLPLFDTQSGNRALLGAYTQFSLDIRADVAIENVLGQPATLTVRSGLIVLVPRFSGGTLFTGITSPPAILGASDGIPGTGPDYRAFGRLDAIFGASDRVSFLEQWLGSGLLPVDISMSGGFQFDPSRYALYVTNFRVQGSVGVTYSFTPDGGTGMTLAMGAGVLVIRRRRAA